MSWKLHSVTEERALERAAVACERRHAHSSKVKRKRKKKLPKSFVLLAIEDKETHSRTVRIVVGAKFRATLL